MKPGEWLRSCVYTHMNAPVCAGEISISQQRPGVAPSHRVAIAGAAFPCRYPFEQPSQAIGGGASPHIHCLGNDSIQPQTSPAGVDRHGIARGTSAGASTLWMAFHSKDIIKFWATKHLATLVFLHGSSTPQAGGRKGTEILKPSMDTKNRLWRYPCRTLHAATGAAAGRRRRRRHHIANIYTAARPTPPCR